jgi:DNA-binding transcriptional LysR family regulator
MEMHQVRYFLAVVETKSFTRAADLCHVSQPSLTAAIKKLEEELGEQLFLRERGGTKLTPFGERVLPRFRRLALESDSIRELAESHRRLERVPLRLGVLSTIGPARIVAMLRELLDRAPGIEVEIHVGTNPELMQKLEEAELEAAISNLGTERVREQCVIAALYQERYLVVLPPGHPLEGRDGLQLSDLSGQPYLDRLACEMRENVMKECRDRDVRLYASYRTSREDWIQTMVRAGLGFAFMPEHSILTGETINRTLTDPKLERTISMVRWVDRPLSAVLELFWKTMKAQRPFS